ncbi:hypothetical protein HanPSC8_Chr17g0786821 [Helianthus annuus]|nr:hypothetical protein HanPSC8_Chr17g0786821 [Helianthus annuus]
MMRNIIKIKNILIMSHLFDDIWFKCFKRAPRAPSTCDNVSSMLSSILISPWWATIVAKFVNIPLSSVIVDSTL